MENIGKFICFYSFTSLLKCNVKMMNKIGYKAYYRYTWFLVGAVFLVILAGGTVRMTQSGMGCPDWPRCFGMWIPPVNEAQLPADFESYLDKQDIDHSFNAYHTWIEYINRLLGALLGVFVFIYLIWSFRLRKKLGWKFFFTALGLFLLTGFQGWLGKLVVEGNLAVSKITIHMLVAIIIAGLPFINIRMFDSTKSKVKSWVKYVPIVVMLLVLIQVVLGTQVREEVDIISKALQYGQRELWIERLGSEFTIHRSFSWLLLLAVGALVYLFKDIKDVKFDIVLVVGFTFVNILIGVIMAYLDVPAIAQPMHLMGACGLVVVLFNFYLKLSNTVK